MTGSPVSYIDLFKVEAMIPELATSAKDDVVEEMVSAAVAGGVLPKARRQQAIDAIQAREARGSTGLGKISAPWMASPCTCWCC